MQKIYVSALLLVITVQLQAQKIKTDETDKFTKERRVETDYFKVFGNMKTGLYTQVWSIDNRCYMSVGAYGYGSPVIGSNDKLMILTNNDSTVVCQSPEIQTGNLNGTFNFKYRISLNDIRYLSLYQIKAIRIEGTRGNIDMDIPEKHRPKLQALFEVWIKTYNK